MNYISVHKNTKQHKILILKWWGYIFYGILGLFFSGCFMMENEKMILSFPMDSLRYLFPSQFDLVFYNASIHLGGPMDSYFCLNKEVDTFTCKDIIKETQINAKYIEKALKLLSTMYELDDIYSSQVLVKFEEENNQVIFFIFPDNPDNKKRYCNFCIDPYIEMRYDLKTNVITKVKCYLHRSLRFNSKKDVDIKMYTIEYLDILQIDKYVRPIFDYYGIDIESIKKHIDEEKIILRKFMCNHYIFISLDKLKYEGSILDNILIIINTKRGMITSFEIIK